MWKKNPFNVKIFPLKVEGKFSLSHLTRFTRVKVIIKKCNRYFTEYKDSIKQTKVHCDLLKSPKSQITGIFWN